MTFVRHLLTVRLLRGYGLRIDLVCPAPQRLRLVSASGSSVTPEQS